MRSCRPTPGWAAREVQYEFQPVPGDTVSSVTRPDQDAGISYALEREAKEAAEKHNTAVRMISAFTARLAALQRAAGEAGQQDKSKIQAKVGTWG